MLSLFRIVFDGIAVFCLSLYPKEKTNDTKTNNMAFSAVLEIGDNTTRRYYKQFLLTDLCIVFNRSYNVIPTGAARCERLDIVVVAPGKEDLLKCR